MGPAAHSRLAPAAAHQRCPLACSDSHAAVRHSCRQQITALMARLGQQRCVLDDPGDHRTPTSCLAIRAYRDPSSVKLRGAYPHSLACSIRCAAQDMGVPPCMADGEADEVGAG